MTGFDGSECPPRAPGQRDRDQNLFVRNAARYDLRMTGEVQLLLWIAGVHILGLLCVAVLLIPALRSDDHPTNGDSGSDEGWGNLPAEPPRPKLWPGGGIPLPDAVQSTVRLRGPGRLSDLLPSRQRRPAREPVRTPSRPVRATRRAVTASRDSSRRR